MKKIFAVTYAGGHANMIMPLLRNIEELEKQMKMKVLALTIAYRKFEQAQLPNVRLEQYEHLFEDILPEVQKYGRELAKTWHNPASGLSEAESVLYLGLSMWDLIQKKGVEGAANAMKRIGRNAFLPTLIAERILTFEKPDIVLATSSPRMEKAFLIAAHQMGIATIRMEDLFGYSHIYLGEGGTELPEVTKTIVPNQIAKENLGKQGVSLDSIEVLGSPAFDHIFSSSKEKIDIELNFWLKNAVDKKIVFWASDLPSEGERVFEQILSAVDVCENIYLIFKMHPNETQDMYSPIAAKHKSAKRVRMVKEMPSYELVKLADITITQVSTVGYEALLLDKPLIIADTPQSNAIFCYSSLGLAVKAYTIEDFIKYFSQLICDSSTLQQLEAQRKKIKQQGNATSNIIQLMKSMLGIR